MIAYNEDVMLQFTLDHYKERFPSARFTIFDNESTDNTRKIAIKNGCEVINFCTNNEINEYKITELKNNCWKSSDCPWICVCDPDELLDITHAQLIEEAKRDVTIVKSEGWNMVNLENNYDLDNIKHGTRVPQYDKNYLFNKNYIKEMNYSHGCHGSSPIGLIKRSEMAYKLYHYKCINEEYHVLRHKWTAQRLSTDNKNAGMGTYWLADEASVRAGFRSGQEQAKNNKVRN